MSMSKKFFIVLSLFSFLSLTSLSSFAMPQPLNHHRGFENRSYCERTYHTQYKRPARIDVNYNYNYGYSSNHHATTGAIVTGGILGGIVGAIIGASF